MTLATSKFVIWLVPNMKVAMQGQYHEEGKVLNIHFQFIIPQESLLGPLKITVNDGVGYRRVA